MDIILKAKKLSKNYYSKKVLKDIDIEVAKGKILGLLGPNGSGKTTFIKIVAGIIRPSSGEILIDGQKPGVYTKSIVSYLPDVNFLFRWMRIKDAMSFFKDFYPDFDIEKARRLLEFMELTEDKRITTLSKGMVEKLHLTLVLSRKAKLYVLDEPLGGIDPVARDKIIDAIVDNFNEESSLIISTHLVKDIERLFDEVAFISKGEIVLRGNAEELRAERHKSIEEIFREVFQ